jgi:hypothetical protein
VNMHNNKLEAALDHARAGFHIFPLTPDSKKPLFADTNWRQIATSNPEQIRAWWEQHPNANIGATTDGFIAIDVDPRNGGDKSFLELLALCDLRGDELPKTRRHKTRAGGDHIIYRQPPGAVVANSKNKLGAGIDVKATGGYIVAPGSVVEGKPYTLENDRSIAEAPAWLIALCRQARARSAAAGKRLVEQDEIAIQMAQDWLAKNAPDAEAGERNNTAYWVAANLFDPGISYETGHEMLAEWALDHTFPPMDSEEIEQVARSAYKNRKEPIGGKHPKTGFNAVKIEDRPGQSESSEAGGKQQDQSKQRPKYYALSFAEACQRAATHVAKPLVKDWLLCSASSVVFGDTNVGKTFFVLDICYHIAAGLPWAGLRVTQGAVLYIAAEGGLGIYKRFEALRLKYGGAEVPLHLAPCSIDLRTTSQARDWVIAEIERMKAQTGVPVVLVVVDTLARALNGGQESGSEHMGAIISNMDIVRERTGVHFTFIHHSGKTPGRGARGWSGLPCAVDTEIELTVDKSGRFIAEAVKQRDLEKGQTLRFKLEKGVRVGTDPEDGSPITSCTIKVITGSAEGFEPIPLTPEEQEVYDAVLTAVTREAPLADMEIGEYPFDWEFASRAVMEKRTLAGARKDARSKGTKRASIQRKLTALTSKGRAAKLKEGQWVVS